MKRNRNQQENRRHRWFADPRLQCGLLARTILYWLYSVCTIFAVSLVWMVFARRPQTPAEWIGEVGLYGGPVAVGLLLILPLALLDCLRFSRRFAGPMVRFRRALHDLANGDPVDPLELRAGDFWCDLSRDLNRVSQRMDELQAQRPQPSTPEREQPATSATADKGLEATAEFTLPILPNPPLAAASRASQSPASPAGTRGPLPSPAEAGNAVPGTAPNTFVNIYA